MEVGLPTAARETMWRLGGVLRAAWLPQATSTTRFPVRAATSHRSHQLFKKNLGPFLPFGMFINGRKNAFYRRVVGAVPMRSPRRGRVEGGRGGTSTSSRHLSTTSSASRGATVRLVRLLRQLSNVTSSPRATSDRGSV